MTDPRIDAERLAALLDGRLDGPSREAALHELADADDDTRAAYADAAAIARELEADAGAEPGAPVLPFRRDSARARRWPRWTMLAAAGLAGVILVPWAVTRSRAGDVEPGRLVAALSVEGGSAMVPASVWPVTRGSSAPMTARGRAVRLGARLVDLELAIAARDSGMAAVVASEVVALLVADPPLTGAPVDLYRQLASSGAPVEAAERRDAWELVADLAGEREARLGAWLEAARVAVVRRDAGFFASRLTRGVLGEAVPSEDADARRAMERVRGAVGGEGAPDWGVLERELGEALRGAGR